MSPVDATTLRPIEADAEEAAALARTEYERFGAVLDGLTGADWERPTDCAGWDVRHLVAHVVGATEANAHPLEMARQLRQGRRGAAVAVDPVSEFQIRTRLHLDPSVLRARYHQAVPGAVAWRRRLLRRVVGSVRFPVGAPVHERWTMAHLAGVIYTRDTWMHRVDLCRATRQAMVLTPGHDGRVVSDVVAEWARRHGRPFHLILTGPAGGEYVGAGGPPDETLNLDAVEMCRVLTGRAPGTGLLATPVPF